MNSTLSLSIARALGAIVAVATLAACAQDGPLAPDRLAPAAATATAPLPLPDGCGTIQPDAGSALAFRAYAKGVQIYRWTGTQWGFVGPEATLYANAGFEGAVGTHYATAQGPAWESVSGSRVVGTVLRRCTVDPASIPWLLLGAVAERGPGIFDGTTFIQRVNTVGGIAPVAPGSTVGEEARIPYTTEYYFYRAQ